MPLVQNVGGVPTYDQSMYGSNANYKRAWDEESAAHQQKYGSGYTTESSAQNIEREIQRRMSGYGGSVGAGAQPGAGGMTAVQSGGVGSGSYGVGGTGGGAPGQGGSSSQFGFAASVADPWANQRSQYQTALNQLMQGGESAIAADPSFQARMKSGQDALARSAAAKGFLGSGNILQEITKYGQELASQEYGNQFSRLSQLAGVDKSSPTAAANILAQIPGQNLAEQTAGFNQSIAAQKLPYELTALQQQNQQGAADQSMTAMQQKLLEQQMKDMQLASNQKIAELMKQVNAPTMAPSNSYTNVSNNMGLSFVPTSGYAPVAPTADVIQQRKMDLGLVPFLSTSFGSLA